MSKPLSDQPVLSIFRRGLPVILAMMLALGSLGSVGVPRALAALGWVGDLYPWGGTSTPGSPYNIQVQVYKAGVTEGAGAGAGIHCTLQWAAVPFRNGAWTGTTDIPMAYASDIGNNDLYQATIAPGLGLYEYRAYCKDSVDNIASWTSFNGELVVKTSGGSCDGATQADENIFYSGLLHDSFDPVYRSPVGPAPTGLQKVTLKLRTCMNDLQSAPQVRLWDDRTNTERTETMTQAGYGSDPAAGTVAFWRYDLPVPAAPTILYYVFKIAAGPNNVYYYDDDPRFYGGGYGQAGSDQSTAYSNSYQLTVYDPAFSVPDWMQRGIVYQVFPDRFRDGSSANNPQDGRFAYNAPGGTIARSNTGANNPNLDWNYTICDPRASQGYGFDCAGKYSDNFYGGDLAGITEKINQGYFDNLGISVLYLNPIFRSPSNHKYDTADYMTIDPDFGSLADFQALAAAAHSHGIKLVLDGVFNHTSSDSKYFDLYSRYDASGSLVSPNGIGSDDNSGACEAGASPFFSWFYFQDVMNPGRDNDSNVVYCANGAGNAAQPYEAWYGYASLPKLRANAAAVRSLIWSSGLNSVGPYWTSQGADGWRFDVGGDVDGGLTNDPTNDYWEGFRAAVRDGSVTGKSDTLMLGEEWGDASAWLLGGEWDSVMNYRFRSAVLSWLFTGCSGDGCTGTAFQDNDSNPSSASGEISRISPSQFNARLRSIAEDYPPAAFKAMMNLEGSHDTNRLRFLLKKINNNSDAAAIQRMKEWWLFAFTYAGAPTLYYGDEIALSHDGVWSGGRWEDDPYNRAPYPWPDASGSSYAPMAETFDFARRMASIRLSYRALQDGDVQHGLVIDDANKLYGFGRTINDGVPMTALIVLNRDTASHSVMLNGLDAPPYSLADNTALVDPISGATYVVSGGAVTLTVNGSWGAVLLEEDKIERPEAAGPAITRTGNQVELRWEPVTKDTDGGRELATAYEIHRSLDPAFTPGSETLVEIITPSTFGSSDGLVHYATQAGGQTYYYIIRARNAAWQSSDSAAVATPDVKVYLPMVGRR